MRHVVELCGFCGVGVGLWLIWPPLAILVGGLLLLAVSYAMVPKQRGDE
jgi:hypothetical protein